jgi:hypothetical protein
MAPRNTLTGEQIMLSKNQYKTSVAITYFHRAFQLLIFSFVIVFCTSGCVLLPQEFDFEKQKIFEARFSEGMSKKEVEKILEGIGNYEFGEDWTFPNGDLRLEYHTNSREWGSPTYYFRFTPDDSLVTLFPVNP